MKRWLLIALIGVAVAGALAAGAWQVAYAQGEAAGRAAVAAARTDFAQARQAQARQGAGGTPAADANATPGAHPTAGPGGDQGGQGGQGGRGGGAPVVGTVDKIDGSTLTVTTSAGAVTVTLGDQTQIRRQVAASAGDLKAGDRVVVNGTRAADGAVTAAAVQIQGS